MAVGLWGGRALWQRGHSGALRAAYFMVAGNRKKRVKKERDGDKTHP
jgi:hypothetical protein